MSRNVLVVAAHPDDEILGCGATLARHAAAGDRVCVLIVAEGATSRCAVRSRTEHREELDSLAACARRAAARLGVADVKLLDFPDNRLDGIPRLDVVKAIEAHAGEVAPALVYTHFPGDLNVDHQMVHEAVMTAFRPLPGTACATVLLFETPSATEWRGPAAAHPFAPTWFVDVSRYLDAKLAALEVYEGEMRPFPHARSISAVEALARWRGASVGVEAAEAFVLARHVRIAEGERS